MEYVDPRGYMGVFDKLLKNVGNVCLIGETGCGKTQLVHAYCERNNVLLLETSLTADTTRTELLATGSDSGSSSGRKGIVAEWLETDPARTMSADGRPFDAVMCYWDGFNYASPSVTALLESLADFRGTVRIPETGMVYRRSEKHLFVISMNPSEGDGYAGTFKVNIAQRRRFETIRMEWLDPVTETDLLVKRTGVEFGFARALVEFANRTREAYRGGRLSTALTTGNLMNYSFLFIDGVDEETIVKTATNQFLEKESGTVHALWHSPTRP
ncbi:MAG: hypothetical protein A3K67_06930 [Euryarchaeota archaeon RBG_16_62_10]|nr:MAG: hypothetical protein A3K67_06930 [Euryarchaeota archaeon RBG_16_62_10]